MVAIFCLVLISFTAQAVRLMDEGDGPYEGKKPGTSQVDWDGLLLQKLITQKVNYAIVTQALNSNQNNPDSALESHFSQLIKAFPDQIQSSLKEAWLRQDWIKFSPRAEHYLDASPVGESEVYGLDSFQIKLDQRLESLPLLTKLMKMITLTHVIGPQLNVLQQEGIAFYQQTYRAHKSVTEITAYWSLMLWLETMQMQKAVQTEIRASGLELLKIRSVMSQLAEITRGAPDAEFNKYIKIHHPLVLARPKLKEYLENWWRLAELEPAFGIKKTEPLKSSFEIKESARIIAFPKKKKISCEGLFAM